jgi:hypothetical protein
MSFHRPRTRKSKYDRKTDAPLSTPETPTRYQLVNADSSHKQRRPYGSSDLDILPERLLFEPRASFTQVAVPRDSNYQQIPISDDPFSAFSQDDTYIEGLNASFHITSTIPAPASVKKERLWKKWEHEIVPSLIPPYLQLLRVSESLRHSNYPEQNLSCSCNSQRNLELSCLYFDSESFCKL